MGNPLKAKAQATLYNAINAGMLLTRPINCSKCNSIRTEAHHWSYLPENRLNTIWLCSSCLMQLHAKMKREKQLEKEVI